MQMSESYQKPKNLSLPASLPKTVREIDSLPDNTCSPDLLATLGLDDQEPSTFAPPSELLIGHIIGRKYELMDSLGAGGMGFVYKAKHVELDKLVAIKILLLDKPLSDIAYQRFAQEAKATGGLDHPNIVRVSDYGQIGEGCPYIVMELLQGRSLDDLISQEQCLKVEDALPLFIQLADALVHAHSRGVIHRDLKPSNIMLVNDDKGERQAKIIDFGIAKLSGARAKAKPLTKPGEIFGSPLYMSPEQCTGNSLDQRSDIYSLGCVMYEMLLGKPPFVGDTVLATIYMHVNEPVARISESAVKAAIPDELEKIIERMLHKNPDLRFQSANELLTELKTFGRKYTETAQMHQTLSKLSSVAFWRSKPAILTVLALSLAAAIWVFLSQGKLNSTSDSEVSNASTGLTHTHGGSKKIPLNRRVR